MNKTILSINSSGRKTNSKTRYMVKKVIDCIQVSHDHLNVTERDVASGIPFIDESWIGANFTPNEHRNQIQVDQLKHSHELVAEINQADYLVIGSPIYNFSIPAVLKAWVDQIARVKMTFKYTEQGPIGLMTGKKVILVIASDGVPIDSELDFATPYLRQVMNFIGITDITVIDANNNDSLTEQLSMFNYNINNNIDLSGAKHG